MFLEVFIVGVLAGIAPGPDFAVVMRNSLGFGRRSGRLTAFGIAAALVLHVCYTVLGFAVLLQQNVNLFHLIQGAGAVYLVWLGLQALRSGPAGAENAAAESLVADGTKRRWESFRDGFLCNALNPKAPLFFLSIFPQFLTKDTPQWMQWVYGLEIVVAVGGWFVLLALIGSSAWFRRFYHRNKHWFDRILGGVLLCFAVRIFAAIAGWGE